MLLHFLRYCRHLHWIPPPLPRSLPVVSHYTIEESWNILTNIIEDAVSSFVPNKQTSSRYSQPWITRQCRRATRRKKRAYRKAKRTNNQLDWDRYNDLRRRAQTECKRANIDYTSRNVNHDFNNNTKKFYTYIKNKKCDNNGVAPLEENGKLLSSKKDIADCLNRQFVSVFSTDRHKPPDLGPSPYQKMPDITIDEAGVRTLLKKQKPNKAAGPDKIQARLLKETADQLAPALTIIFNASFKQSKIPDEWRHAIVSPIYKTGKNNRSKAVNYRPISLTCLCCKAMEHIVCSNMMSHLDKNKIITDFQHGFRKRRSCDSQLILTVDDLAKTLNQGKQADCILLDFSKAFDKVSHSRLSTKLKYYGVNGLTLNWITDFLSSRSKVVVVRGEESERARVTSGVPQGSVLGPALFLVYINDLPEKVKSTPRLFADDCLLYRVIDSEEDSIILQQDLDALAKWEEDWAMEFAPEKCKLLRITRKTARKTITAKYNIHGTELELVKEATYLGVTLDKTLTFSSHITSTIKKADKSRQFLQRNLRGCSKQVKAASYTTFVRPIAEYASTVWDPHKSNATIAGKLKAMQHRAARLACVDWRRDSSITKMIAGLEWQSLQERRIQARLDRLQRIQNGTVAISLTCLPPVSYLQRPTQCILLTKRHLHNTTHMHRPLQKHFLPSHSRALE